MGEIERASIDERRTTEYIFGEFGFCVRWKCQDHWADVEVFEIIARDEGNLPMYELKGARVLPSDSTTEPDDAEPYLKGFVKWDGCAELDMGRPHWCGGASFKKHCDLLKHIYHRAFELMGREPDVSDGGWPE